MTIRLGCCWSAGRAQLKRQMHGVSIRGHSTAMTDHARIYPVVVNVVVEGFTPVVAAWETDPMFLAQLLCRSIAHARLKGLCQTLSDRLILGPVKPT